MKILKQVLIGSFWSFLLTLSGIIDIIIGVLVLTGIIPVDEHSLMVSIICFIVGLLYMSGGLIIAAVKARKKN